MDLASHFRACGTRCGNPTVQPAAASSEELDAAASVETDLVERQIPLSISTSSSASARMAMLRSSPRSNAVAPMVAEDQGPLSSITCELLAADGG